MADPLEKQKRKAALYAEILRFNQNVDYDKMLKSCNRLLHEFPTEQTAFEAKIVSCIQLSKFKEALDFINRNPQLSGNLDFEHAYCCYRLNDIVKAEEILRSSTSEEESPRKSELLAQIYYRLEQFEKSYDLYRDVIKNSADEWESERQTNLLAISACLGFSGIKKNIPFPQGDSYELKYNIGCVKVSQGEYADAENILVEAETECIQGLEEDAVPEEEIEDEICIIRVQRGYCSQKLGRPKEAMHIYSKALKAKPSDLGLAAVGANNILSLNRDQNIFDSKKRLKTINSDGVDSRITRHQLCTMKVNQCLFYLHINQYDQCKELCEELLQNYPEAREEIVLIKAAVIAKTNGVDGSGDNIERVIKELKDDPKAALRVRLGLVQQVLRGGKRVEAIELLKKLGKDMYLPGIVSALVTLYQADGEVNVAGKIIRDAINYYKEHKIHNAHMNVLWQQSVALLMQQGDYNGAVHSLEEQYKLQPDNRATLAQLIIAYSKIDISKAEQLSKKLPKPVVDYSEVSALESPNWQVNLKLAKKGQQPDSTPTSPEKKKLDIESPGNDIKLIKKKKKKKKKKHIPANFDPDCSPDPERWLPKYERSTYKAKKTRSKGKVDVGKGTQGTTAEAAAQFDMTGKVKSGANQIPDSPGGDGPSPSASGDHRKGANANKKKKKR